MAEGEDLPAAGPVAPAAEGVAAPAPRAPVRAAEAGADNGAGGRAGKRKSRRRKKRRAVYVHAPGRANQPPPAGSAVVTDSIVVAELAAGRGVEAIAVAPSAAPQVNLRPLFAGDARPARGEATPYAALDLGTNNCRLLIAVPRERGFRVVDAFSRIVRLGEGIAASGRLSEAAQDRAVGALAICAAKLAQRQVARTRLIATEACRQAANGPEFIERVARDTGLRLEIVSRETEARLAVAGCASLIDPNASGALLFDIGGGSSELVWIDLRREPGTPRRRMAERVRSWMSLPVGVVNLSERHGGREVTPAAFAAMVDEVHALLDAFPDARGLDAAVAGGGVHLLGTSGTVTTVAGVHLGLERYDRRRVDGVWLDDGEVSTVVGRLVATDYAGRIANPCIGRERADLVLAGCAILEAVRRRWPCRRLRVADRGLREGMLVELMSADGVWRLGGRRRTGDGSRPEARPQAARAEG